MRKGCCDHSVGEDHVVITLTNCTVVFSIAEGRVQPRDRSERTNINSKSKETGMSMKLSV